jgi:hypothetical protein
MGLLASSNPTGNETSKFRRTLTSKTLSRPLPRFSGISKLVYSSKKLSFLKFKTIISFQTFLKQLIKLFLISLLAFISSYVWGDFKFKLDPSITYFYSNKLFS